MLDSILGQETRIFQPPLTMSRSPTTREHLRPRKSRSVDSYDRRPVEQALTREGVHRPIDIEKLKQPLTERDDIAATGRDVAKPSPSPHPEGPHISPPPSHDGPSSPNKTRFAPPQQPHYTSTLNEAKIYGKGQAHDPLSDFLFLSIGPSSTVSSAEPNSPDGAPTVSESPSAAEGNIYEAAYHEEVERIRRNSEHATLYLTRRVKNTEKYKGDGNMKGVDERHAYGATGWGKMLQLAKGKSKMKEEEGRADEDGNAEAGKRGRADGEEDDVRTEGGLKRLVEKLKLDGLLHDEKG